MSKQITVRLPDELVRFIDQLVDESRAASRTAVVARALERERRRELAARDLRILSELGKLPGLTNVTIAQIATPARGLSTEVAVGRENGLDQVSVICCDRIDTIKKDQLGRQIGFLLPEQEDELRAAIRHAFDLERPS